MSHRTLRTIDVVLVCWLLLWCAIGYTVGHTVNGLSGLSDGVIGAGEGVSDAAGALTDLTDVPLIGGSVEAIADRIDALGQGTVQKAEASKDVIFNVSLLLGLLIALAPVGAADRGVARDPLAARTRPAPDRPLARRRRRWARGVPRAAGGHALFLRAHLVGHDRSVGRPAGRDGTRRSPSIELGRLGLTRRAARASLPPE